MPNGRKLSRRKRQLLSYEDVVELLRTVIDRAGTESEWARRTGANRTSLNLALKGRVGLQKNILDALGLKKVVVVAYEPARRP
jgi:DNA-binding phage protein